MFITVQCRSIYLLVVLGLLGSVLGLPPPPILCSLFSLKVTDMDIALLLDKGIVVNAET